MSVDRVIPAKHVDHGQVAAFPYFTATFSPVLPEGEEGETDDPLGSTLSTPEEDVRRLASVDQIIFEKMQQAERDAQDTARKGYEEGFAAGESEGRQFGESQYRAHLLTLGGHLQAMSESLSLHDRAAKDEILALALAMAEYLAGRAIENGPLTLQPLLDSILDAHPFPTAAGDGPEDAALTIFMNPKDLEELNAAENPGVTLREDGELTRGSLRVESGVGVLDATMERRKAKLMDLIQRLREQDGAS